MGWDENSFHYGGKELVDVDAWLSEVRRVLKLNGIAYMLGADWHIADIAKSIPDGLAIMKHKERGKVDSTIAMRKVEA